MKLLLVKYLYELYDPSESVLMGGQHQQKLVQTGFNEDTKTEKYGVIGANKYKSIRTELTLTSITLVAGRQPPGEEVGRVALFQPLTKLVIAQFQKI